MLQAKGKSNVLTLSCYISSCYNTSERNICHEEIADFDREITERFNMKVNFYEAVEDNLLKFAVIIAKTKGQYVFCKHKERDTLEVPGGHREPGESILTTAKRELYEETGAVNFEIEPICVYSVVADSDSEESFGMLYRAEIKAFEPELHSEIERIVIMDGVPEKWTYPEIQPKLIEEAKKREKGSPDGEQ